MRITRVREFKKSTEITIVLEGNDAQALCHAIDPFCGDKCRYPIRQQYGKQLLVDLWLEIRKHWIVWED